ncbi:MAG TPA: RnfABCDGE type electron transport complex subunit D [Anaerohalosphaeraceae bacterium]|jgi:Na+-transporting NADH:ubiquinone oxidoreductase subunit B|nr:RnfABCDGE type electron transport complex subunit D [Anaerohalosphaeraceae bacterium]
MIRQTQSNWLRKQPIMRKVLLALVPCVLGGWYYFGIQTLALTLFCCLWGFFLEWLFCRKRGEPVSEAVFVTAVLFALTMPAGVGWHVAAVGMAFAVIFSKEVFGGFGRNFFNPALAGRCFVYICFPIAMTGVWQPPAEGPWGSLTRWSSAADEDGSIAVTSATPMAHKKAGRIQFGSWTEPALPASLPFQIDPAGGQIIVSKWTMMKGLLFGRIGGTMGATSAVLITLGGIYLFVTGTASRTIILSVIGSYAVFNQIFYWFGVAPVPGAWPAVLGGGFLLGAFFMSTDPVSSPRTEPARIIYGILIGLASLVIRNFSIFNGGLMFAILLGNMFTPILDVAVKAWQQRGKTTVDGRAKA